MKKKTIIRLISLVTEKKKTIEEMYQYKSKAEEDYEWCKLDILETELNDELEVEEKELTE